MAKETLEQKKKRAAKIAELLHKQYPNAKCTLRFENPLQLLIATILAAQSTDKGVNAITPTLFSRYRTAEEWADAPTEELEPQLKSTGFYRNKTKAVRAASRMIVEKFGGEVPKTMSELLSLPGVAQDRQRGLKQRLRDQRGNHCGHARDPRGRAPGADREH